MRIGTFRSLSNPHQRYAIFRNGKPAKDHGNGVVWKCACPGGSAWSPCKHLRCLWSYARHDSLQMLVDSGFITLTKVGVNYFERSKPECCVE